MLFKKHWRRMKIQMYSIWQRSDDLIETRSDHLSRSYSDRDWAHFFTAMSDFTYICNKINLRDHHQSVRFLHHRYFGQHIPSVDKQNR